MDGLQAAVAVSDAPDAIDRLQEARERTLELVAPFSDDELEQVHSTLMSPLVWDLGHIAAFEDLWIVHRFAGEPLLREEMADVYDAFETPRAGRGELPFLRPREARDYLQEVRERALEVIERRGVGDGIIAELIVRHEQQHNETMLQTIQLAQLEGLSEFAAAGATVLSGTGAGVTPGTGSARSFTGLELVEIPAGPCTIGARPVGFAYDNERPRHRTDVRGYMIGRTPITNATYLTFVEGGGYERREWWSDEGWSWKEDYDITRPQSWTADLRSEWRLSGLEPLHPDRPVVHISWFEADAFARAHAGRLPTETEWEKAATWDQEHQTSLLYPWGNDPVVPGLHANTDQRAGGSVAAGSLPDGASPYGVLGMIGDVWEWTSSNFTGYPGFAPFPYREYSEVFFGDQYKVLRGGAWATRPRVVSPTFRNWDFPQRRQIFSGLRIAKDL
ncbi:MAG TPA: ergothioneine biosynthesis protein EgtB [Solirubrobacteraceae bacterium]|jgi:iron(II)-dependent oxidoreductase|nr:ergothioneine biosynthesis protein EgtB [Solirubrobacteraceae bacterium]